MTDEPEDICPRPEFLPPQPTEPLAPAIHPAAVYRCHDPEQAAKLLSGELPGYVYGRDGHPNADMLAEKCRQLHAADRAAICASGMSALALAALVTLESGDHVIVSDMLYGRTLQLFGPELARWGVKSSQVDACNLDEVRRALEQPRSRLCIVESISNPLVRVADLQAMSALAHSAGARLLVNNTFAGPALCRPLALGADLVVESLTKAMSGHSDVVLGLLCGRDDLWPRVTTTLSTWGLMSSPFDCWLALRGLGTYALRVRAAAANALAAAQFLGTRSEISAVYYPGLATHPDHALARRQFGEQFGTVLSFTLAGGRAAAESFIQHARRIPFCPSLGDLSTTLSHPTSTSHRSQPAAERERLGITEGTIRLSLGIESPESVLAALAEGLRNEPSRK